MNLLVLPGDGIGPEIVSAAVEVLKEVDRTFALGLSFEWDQVGFASLKERGTTFPAEVLTRARKASGVILGPISHKEYPRVEIGGKNPSAELRKGLDLFANVRPARALKGLSRFADLDLIIVRENTEGFYADRNMYEGTGEFAPTEDIALAVRKITRRASERVTRVGCELALERRKRVTLVHKANVLRISDGLFLRAANAVAGEYKTIAVDDMLVDAMASLLVRCPGQFDVIVTTNMFGDILSNLTAELAGGLGASGSLNAGDNHAMAQAAHGSAPDIAGRGTANPAGLIYSVAMLLKWLGRQHKQTKLGDAGLTLDLAMTAVMTDKGVRTPDLGGVASTRAMTDAVIQCLAQV